MAFFQAATVCVMCCLFFGADALSQEQDEVFERNLYKKNLNEGNLFHALNDDINAKTGFSPLLPVQLDFKRFLEVLNEQPQLSSKQIARWQDSLALLNPSNICEQLQHKNMSLQLSLMKERNDLLKLGVPDYPGRFIDMKHGQKWYRHWLKSWLLDEVDISSLQKIAQQDLKKVTKLKGELDNKFSGKQSSVSPSRYHESEHRQIVAAFRTRESKVIEQLDKVFGVKNTIPTVRIEASNLPKSFPAPGIYNTFSDTFYYHIQTSHLETRQMDWLYMHEGVPGHHFQNIMVETQAICPSHRGFPRPMVSSEGWAAYVESLGGELGLFTDTESEAYALEWRTLRALRVLIDIGIHSLGWEDEKAQALWRQYLPETDDIMNREIKRIKRWPVQVITYVYGKSQIEQAINHSARGKSPSEVSKIRNLVVRMTNHPPHAYRFIPYFLDLNTHS